MKARTKPRTSSTGQSGGDPERRAVGVTSKEFHRLMDEALAPACAQLGLTRVRGQVSSWRSQLPAGTLEYVVSKGAKRPYVAGTGGRFGVAIHLVAEGDTRGRDHLNFISFMEYMSDADLEAMKNLKDRILTKIVSQKLTDPTLQGLLEASEPLLRLELGQPFHRHRVLGNLPYLDAEDVEAWGGLLAACLSTTVRGIRENPVFFMRSTD